MAAVSSSILFGSLKVYTSCFKQIGTIKPAGGWWWWTAQSLYNDLFCTKEKAGGKGGGLSGGGLTGDYCSVSLYNF